MKHKYTYTFLLLFACHFLQAANILSNPGFESAGDWWYFQNEGGTATIDYQSTDFYSGSFAAHINVTEAATDNHLIQLQAPGNWTPEAGTEYRFSFWAKADQNVPVHVAVNSGPNGTYTYLKGVDKNLGTEWQQYEITYTPEVSVEGEVLFKIYVGANVANYYFDDFVLETVSDVELAAPTPPTEGAYYTDEYRNMFLELGKSEAAINSKVESAFQQLFYGGEDQKVYYEVGDDMAFIKDVANNDIRSEGQSYGMMIAVQLDKKEEFDKLWKFAKTYMEHKEGARKGYFAWQVEATEPFSVIDPNSASDGEEYFAMALFFAANRWGNETGIFNYEAEANQLLDDMLNKEEQNGGVVDGITNMFNHVEKQVVFVPEGNSANYTDPSYHLPGFYELWGRWAEKDNQFWFDAAEVSRAYFQEAMHEQTGLTTDYMTFDAQPQATSFNSNSDKFAYDSWRVAGNVAMDAHWFGEDWHSEEIDKLLGFFQTQGDGYPALYHQDGTPTEDTHTSSGLVAMNGAGTLASSDVMAWDFLDAFYNQSVPTGEYRYYDGMLHMLALLHTSGNFKIYKPSAITSDVDAFKSTSEVNIFPNPANSSNTLVVESKTVENGQVVVRDISGRTVVESELTQGRVDLNINSLSKGIYFVEVSNANGSFVNKVVVE